jgi:hypothetical protein
VFGYWCIYEGVGSVKGFFGHTAACTRGSAPFRSSVAIADQGSLLISAGGTRSDPAIYSTTTSTMIITSNSLAGAGLIRQFGFGTVVVGKSRNFQGGLEWLRSLGVRVIDLDSEQCSSLLSEYIRTNPQAPSDKSLGYYQLPLRGSIHTLRSGLTFQLKASSSSQLPALKV